MCSSVILCIYALGIYALCRFIDMCISACLRRRVYICRCVCVNVYGWCIDIYACVDILRCICMYDYTGIRYVCMCVYMNVYVRDFVYIYVL